MKRKNILKSFAFAGLFAFGFAFAAQAQQALVNTSAICDLVTSLKSVFELLRTLAFIGAAFIIAGWAWGYISSGALGKDNKWADEFKGKGIAMIVGFALLFGVGMMLQFLINASGQGGSLQCASQLTGVW